MMECNNEYYEVFQQVTGKPNESSVEEKGRFKKFLSWFSKWFEKKVVAADGFADATLDLKRAEASKTWAEADKNRAEIRKADAETLKILLEAKALAIQMAIDAKKIEEEKLRDAPIRELKQPEDLTEEIKEIEERINNLRIIHGTTITISESTQIPSKPVDISLQADQAGSSEVIVQPE